MISLILLILTGIYLSLFVIAGRRNDSWSARVFWWVILLLPLIVLTWDMPVGYYRYKALCKEEGGLRIYQPNPAPAKVVRLQAERFDQASARSVLATYPTLDAVETLDANFETAEPPAYARYERNPQSPIPARGPRDEFKPLITSLDSVEWRRSNPAGLVTVAVGPSRADYVLTREDELRPIRLSITRHWLRKPDGSPVASTTSVVFSWTDPMNTLLGRTAFEYCGTDQDGSEYDNQRRLIDLVTKIANR